MVDTEQLAAERRLADAEERLRESEERFRKLTQAAPDAIIGLDEQNRISTWNDTAVRMFGFTEREAIGSDLHKLIVPDQYREKAYRGLKKYSETDTGPLVGQTTELTALRKDGTKFPVELSVFNVKRDKAWRTTGIVRDITRRKQVEETLRRRNRELALLNRMGQELTATLDLQKAIEQLLQDVTGTIGAEGASVWLWDEEQDDGCLVCRAFFHHGHKSLPVDLRLCPGQGIASWVAQTGESVVVSNAPDDPRFFPGIDEQTGIRTTSLLAVPLRRQRRVIGVMEVVNKLSGEFDQDDLALVTTLAASGAIAIDNARLVEALRRQAADLQTRNEDLDAFAHTVAHDLQNSLGLIIGYAAVLEEGWATMPGEELGSHLHAIVQNGRKMSNVINSLLLLAKVRKAEVKTQALDMASIVAEALQRLAYMIEEYQAEIIVPDTWPAALGYGPWIEEVWVNYLSNAIQYGDRPPRVEVGATVQAHGKIRFWVRDNGPGLTPEAQARLFIPFSQLDRAQTVGHGLGLSIVRRIVEKMGGEVGWESEAGRGSVFSFTLPGAVISDQ